MDKVKYISHKFVDDVDSIKAMALYFDEINIVEQSYAHIFDKPDGQTREEIDKNGVKRFYKVQSGLTTTEFTSETFKGHIQSLIDAEIITFSNDFGELIDYPREIYAPNQLPTIPVRNSELIVPDDYILPKNETKELYFINNEIINSLIKSNLGDNQSIKTEISTLKVEIDKQRYFYNLMMNNNQNKRITSSNSLESVSDEYKNDLFYVHCYLGKLFQSFIDNFNEGHNTITTSRYLNELIKQTSGVINFPEIKERFKNEFQVNPFLINEAIKLAVPNLSKFPTDEILEFKAKSKDELLAFKSKMNEITFDLMNNHEPEFISLNAQKIADLKIKPLLNDIDKQLGDSKLTIIRTLIQEAKDPKSYSPILLTLSNDYSNSLIYLVSLGIISLNTALEYYSKVKNSKKDGIYYLFKANKYFA